MAREDWKLRKHGRTKDVFSCRDKVMIVMTDRIRIPDFDKALDIEVPDKGVYSTRIAEKWHVLINRQIMTDLVRRNGIFSDDNSSKRSYISSLADENLVEDIFSAYYPKGYSYEKYYQDFGDEYFQGRTMLMVDLDIMPVECIVRGYLSGRAYESYRQTGKVFGAVVPRGLVEDCVLPEPIFTPVAKGIDGRDRPLSIDEYNEVLDGFMPGYGIHLADEIRKQSLLLYKWGADYAMRRGLIMADTKFEFGLRWSNNNRFYLELGDEVFTPDCTRYWMRRCYTTGKKQMGLGAQCIREFLKTHPEYVASGRRLPALFAERVLRQHEQVYQMLFENERSLAAR